MMYTVYTISTFTKHATHFARIHFGHIQISVAENKHASARALEERERERERANVRGFGEANAGVREPFRSVQLGSVSTEF